MKIKPQFNRTKTRNKYGAKKTEVGGIKFDSHHEANVWMQLQLLERAGVITNLERQIRVPLIGQYRNLFTRTGRKMVITFDFRYDEDGVTIYHDAKGMPTRDYEVRVAVAKAMGLEVRET